MSKIILSTGAYRSGSTLQFNILRVILEQAYGDIYSSFIKEYNPKNEAPIHLIKIHEPKADLAAKADFIFSSIRDKADIEASILRRREYDKTLSVDHIDKYLKWWQFWALKADFIQSYKMIKDLPFLANIYRDIMGTYGAFIPHVLSQLEREMVEPAEDFEHHDPKTLLHYKHITK